MMGRSFVMGICYLALAVRLDLPIATLDKKLVAAAKQVGVPIKTF
ncbi:MAG: type II toxin-antitoxin system VapC family toxin [Proteobacteria bacterium]|nr:type II toxin-antitoxin system VapC family toxin [Pseudomonadota bacterium]